MKILNNVNKSILLLILITLLVMPVQNNLTAQIHSGGKEISHLSVNKIDKKYTVFYYRAAQKHSYPYTAVPFKYITHLNHSFIWPEKDGSLVVPDNFLYPELIHAAHLRGVKVIVSLGGWGRDEGFALMSQDSTARENFIHNLTRFCRDNGYDGADIDWEYPRLKDRENFVKIISGLKKSFSSAGIELLTAALPAFDYRNGYDLDTLKYLFDFMGIMTYDYHGSWTNHAGYNCPLYSRPADSCGSIDASMKYFVSKGVPPEKLLIGMAFYGRAFDAKTPNSPSTGGDALSYVTAMNYVKNGWEYHWDNDAAVPYLQDIYHKQVATFEDQASVLEKSRYIFKHGLKGTIVWALNFDYDGKNQPLVEAAGYAITSPVSPYLKNDIADTKDYLLNENNPLIDYAVTPEMKSAYVNVKIYDMLGRVISVPQKGEKPAGKYSVSYSDMPKVKRDGFKYYEVILNGERVTGIIN